LQSIMALILGTFILVSCKTIEQSQLQSQDSSSEIVRKIESSLSSLKKLEQKAALYYVPEITKKFDGVNFNERIRSLKLSEITKVNNEFDNTIKYIEQNAAGFYVDLRDREQGFRKKLIAIYPALDWSQGGHTKSFLWKVGILRGAAVMSAVSRYGSIWEYSADVVVQKKTSFAHFKRKIGAMAIIGSPTYNYRGLGCFFYEDHCKYVAWRLAGSPTVTSSGKEVKKYPPQIMWKDVFDANSVSTMLSRALNSKVDNIRNLRDMHQWMLRYSPVMFFAIDELKIEKGPAAFPTMGGRKGISHMGKSRELNKKKFMENLRLKIEFFESELQAYERFAANELR
jgi:hypothetical protein